MGITGKYNFTGIQKGASAALKAALASTGWGAALLANPWFKFLEPVEDAAVDEAINFLANEGLIVINLGAIVVNGEVDQGMFDRALDDGLKRVELGRDKLTPAQGKAIDDGVIAAARRFIPGSPAPIVKS